MRIPEPFFPLINRVMRALLNSPLHGMLSGSLLVLYFTGAKSGRRRSTPLRYLRQDDAVICLTGRETGWWPNFRKPVPVELQLAGRRVAAIAHALPDDAERKEAALRRMLAAYPSDAAYHGIAVRRGAAPSPEHFQRAVARDVLVVFTLAAPRD